MYIVGMACNVCASGEYLEGIACFTYSEGRNIVLLGWIRKNLETQLSVGMKYPPGTCKICIPSWIATRLCAYVYEI